MREGTGEEVRALSYVGWALFGYSCRGLLLMGPKWGPARISK